MVIFISEKRSLWKDLTPDRDNPEDRRWRMAEEGLHVVLGAGGNIGRAVAGKLAARGSRVRGTTRSGRGDAPEGVELVAADAMDLESLKRALNGASTVYHCMGLLYPLWVTNLPTMMTNVIEAAATQGADTKVVYADNLYGHGKAGALQGSITEQTPLLADGKKGRLRADLARQLLKAHEEGIVRSTIGRGSDFYGPGATNSLFHVFAFPKIVEGKRMSMLADMRKKHSVVYLDDFAEALILLAENGKADGRMWNVPHTETMSIGDFLALAYEVAGFDHRGKIGTMPGVVLTIGALFSRLVREVKEDAYQFQVDWVVDSSEFQKTFGMNPTPVREALAATLNWYSGVEG
jgi:nucleoside-diphosphate-sugar epimerase